MGIYLDTILFCFLCVCACSIFIVQDMAPRTGDVVHPLISIDHSHHIHLLYSIKSSVISLRRWGLESDTIRGIWKGGSTRKEKAWIGTCTNNGARLASLLLFFLLLLLLHLSPSISSIYQRCWELGSHY